MSTDKIDKLFETMKDQLDINEPSANHQIRFLEKLQQQNKVVQLQSKKRSWLRPLMMAASIAILFGITTFTMVFTPEKKADLASVSPQMQETQNFFTAAIYVQLEEINKVSSSATKKIVSDAMLQLEKLESDYETLKGDLVTSGNDKRVISAMIKNFQKRANLLEKVLIEINNINEFKSLKNENSIL